MLLSDTSKGNLPHLEVVIRPPVGVAHNDDLPQIDAVARRFVGVVIFYSENVQLSLFHFFAFFLLKIAILKQKNTKKIHKWEKMGVFYQCNNTKCHSLE